MEFVQDGTALKVSTSNDNKEYCEEVMLAAQ